MGFSLSRVEQFIVYMCPLMKVKESELPEIMLVERKIPKVPYAGE
jgi:hypothetical protein